MYFACLLLIRKSDWKTYFKLLRPGDSDFLCSLGNYSSKIFERCPTVRVEKSEDYGELAPGTPKVFTINTSGKNPFQNVLSKALYLFNPYILY